VLQLEMERLSLAKTAATDRAAASRLGVLDRELQGLKEQQKAITEQWQREKADMDKVQVGGVGPYLSVWLWGCR
jgi:ATP-dependent Clp protease ATP-binding subunit ClpB